MSGTCWTLDRGQEDAMRVTRTSGRVAVELSTISKVRILLEEQPGEGQEKFCDSLTSARSWLDRLEDSLNLVTCKVGHDFR